LNQTWGSPVFGDAFGGIGPAQTEKALRQMSAIAGSFSVELSTYIQAATPQESQAAVTRVVNREILPKTIAFGPALTIGEIDDTSRLGALSVAVGLMYWGDQTMDRGNADMFEAIKLLAPDKAPSRAEAPFGIQNIVSALGRITEKVTYLARPEDAKPWVLDCFYGQVLLNEARMRQLSLDYKQAEDPAAFLAAYADDIATRLTISAGFPSISSSLYAIYRQHDPLLPPLAAVYGDPVMQKMLQTCNATVRLWDELGDWRMDKGDDPTKGVFTINLFNEYSPIIIDKFCSLTDITDTGRRTILQESFAAFHENDVSRQQHGERIENVMLDHIRQYIQELPPKTQRFFDQYITIAKRVLEIGYINRVGDIALTDTTEQHEHES
jgi:hypothetical protein